jgi:hypothetical protein
MKTKLKIGLLIVGFLVVVAFKFPAEVFKDKVLSEVVLVADGPGETYELINSVLAPNYSAIEAPDCSHESFGRHIDEVFDASLKKNVFRFFMHKTPDNNKCKKDDRQRNEIKTYRNSPDNTLAVKNEKVVYNWKFKLDANFQASKGFTHIHQVKAVGGSEENMPLITLSVRKGTPDILELRYAEFAEQTTIKKTDLTPFKGIWVEVTETIVFGEKEVGQYAISIKNVSTNKELFSYSNAKIRTWKTDADFLRPKWGVYRSLKDADNLRDEAVLFADFSIKELEN